MGWLELFRRTARGCDHRTMATSPRADLTRRFIPLDGEVTWACSGQGWNCCVDKEIPLRPYDVHRLAEATGTPARTLLDEGVFTLEWDGYGLLGGWLATRPYEGERHACVFYDEVTTRDARLLRETEPGRFRALPSSVRESASEPGERRVAGLCNVHTGRPEACRAFPFQRHALWEDQPHRAAARVFDCGPCALAEPSTPRQVMLDNGLEPYWRAGEAYRAVAQYLHKAGLANLRNSTYRPLPLSPGERLAFWTALFVSHQPYPAALEATLDAADALVVASGIPREHLGGPGQPIPRPDTAAHLDASRAVLPD